MDLPAICNALGNKTRYQIVRQLKNRSIITCCNRIEYHENGISVGDAVKMTGLAQSTISRHLAVLEDAGILCKEKRELWSCYFLNDELIKQFLEELDKDLNPSVRTPGS